MGALLADALLVGQILMLEAASTATSMSRYVVAVIKTLVSLSVVRYM